MKPKKGNIKRSDFQYSIVLRAGLLLILLLFITILLAFPKFDYIVSSVELPKNGPEIVEIPEIDVEFETPPPPQRPSLPLESDDADYSVEITIPPTTDLGIYIPEIEPPPPLEPFSQMPFHKYDKPPILIGRIDVIYPPMAREAEIEGMVTVKAFINEYGEITECQIYKGLPGTGLDEAAVSAVKNARFIPAMQRDINVGIWIKIPVIFKLQN